jgi:quercetin dioxygenase-like cupin family protein
MSAHQRADAAGAAVVARGAHSERLVFPGGSSITLLADSAVTGGRLSVHRTVLRDGAEGGSPHHHTTVAETLYVVAGQVRALVGDELMEAGAGDLVVIPPGVTHAFAAVPGRDAELLVAVTPGIERFSLFRRIASVRAGCEHADTLADQSQYDTHPDRSAIWEQARTITRTRQDAP